MNDAQQIRIKFSDLILWDENARLPSKYLPSKYLEQSEEQLIHHFCQDKNFKIEKLAKAIVEDFLLPQMERLIVLNRDGKNIVYEGNRRLIVYKLLNNPDLAPSEKLRDWFKKQKIDVSDNFLLDCIVTADENIANKYIERKHLDGNNQVGWGDLERIYHRIRTKTATSEDFRRAGIAGAIRDLPEGEVSEEMKDKVLGHGYVTTLWRLLDSGHALKKYGYELKNEELIIAKEKLFKKELSVIATDVFNKKDKSGKVINSRAWHSDTQKADYLNSLSNADNKSKKTENRDNPSSAARRYLIPKECFIPISNRRINDIYLELKKHLLLDSSAKTVPNAVGVLFRVFLETSLDHYLKKESENLKKQGKEISLRKPIGEKITMVADYMEKQEVATSDQLERIRAVKDKHSDLSIEHFHRLVHSDNEYPELSDLKAKWDNLQEFFQILWNSMKDK